MNDLLLRALRGEPVPRPPVWFFRQAGRYLPEYHDVRNQVDFLTLCRTPELAAEVTLQPLRRFRFDASIVFNDILVPPAAMGLELEFVKGRGPVFNDPVRSRADLSRLQVPSIERDMPHVLETIRQLVAQIDVPLFGFAGAPFTLAAYMLEGGGSKHFRHIKGAMYNDPSMVEALLELLTEIVSEYLQAQIDAGASAVVLFDTWAGELSQGDFDRFALPWAQRALEGVRGAPKLYFTRGGVPFLEKMAGLGVDALALDWRADVADARARLGDLPVMGNLDPLALLAPPAEIRRQVREIIRTAGPRGHVFNLGHGILPFTPVEGVEAAVEAVHEWDWAAEGAP